MNVDNLVVRRFGARWAVYELDDDGCFRADPDRGFRLFVADSDVACYVWIANRRDADWQ